MQRRQLAVEGKTWIVYDVRPSTTLDPALNTGWLCFETSTARRRLSPIPDDWHKLTSEDLSALWERATPAKLPHL